MSNESNYTLKDILGLILYVAVVLLICFFIITYVGQRTRVSGHSMEPTLSDGDNLIVDKISYRFHDPERFDIIIFPYQYEEDTYYIKRIIGLPGETVWINTNGDIYIDGVLLEESYGLERMSYAGLAASPITLGEDEYFVLGDNRNNSTDSRFDVVGPIKRDDIIGKAWVRIYPFDKMTVIKHK
jgi:signal peptidase I